MVWNFSHNINYIAFGLFGVYSDPGDLLLEAAPMLLPWVILSSSAFWSICMVALTENDVGCPLK
jgi:hypothetical protein